MTRRQTLMYLLVLAGAASGIIGAGLMALAAAMWMGG